MFKRALEIVVTVVIAWLMLIVLGTVIRLTQVLLVNAWMKLGEKLNRF